MKDAPKNLRRSPSPLSPAELTIVKKLLWDGMENKEVSVVAGVRLGSPIHPSTVSRIKTGKIGGSVLWPDGSQGGMPERQTEDWSPDSLSLSEWPEEYQETILLQVNERRRALGVEEIPPIADDYATYIQSPPDEREYYDQYTVQDLLKSEDRRRSLLINEFKMLQEDALESNLRDSISSCLQDTAEDRGEDPPPPKDAGWFKYQKADWSSLLLLIPNHTLVLKALRDRDGVLAEAICIVMHDFHGDPKTLDIDNRVYKVHSILSEHAEQSAHIQENSEVASFMEE